MFERGISKQAHQLAKVLASQDFVKGFYLAGGTALALRLGHRLSVDLDFFSEKTFNEKRLQTSLKELGDMTIQFLDAQTINVELNQVKLSFMHYPYMLLSATNDFQGLRIASIEDIACMKIDAISSRGTKRDFIDLYCICLQGFSLKSILLMFEKKYKGIKFNKLHLLKSLTYFEDAESHPLPQMHEKVDWEKIKSYYRNESLKILKSGW